MKKVAAILFSIVTLACAGATQANIVRSGAVSGANAPDQLQDVHANFNVDSAQYIIGWHSTQDQSYKAEFTTGNLINDYFTQIFCEVTILESPDMQVARLAAGDVIGPYSCWSDWSYITSVDCSNFEWIGGGTVSYTGAQLAISDQTHYGSMRICENPAQFELPADQRESGSISDATIATAEVPEPTISALLIVACVARTFRRRHTRQTYKT